MKTLSGMEITYEHSFNVLESLKKSFHDGDEFVNVIEYCEDLISDYRLNNYPNIETSADNHITFNYEDYDNAEAMCDHLVIKIKNYGFNYDDKVLSYFYIKGEETHSKGDASWNEVLDVIRKWNIK